MSEIQQFEQRDIKILNEEVIYNGFFTLKKIQFKHKLLPVVKAILSHGSYLSKVRLRQ
ncbi:ADP-ribose pyrophosphatase [Rodentibacter pneumotropicus]|uniref:ADP-ribose pyrophosphatase n=1 Tax=Rodentibacter pneumotropicus TaxID=758 RepID=A0A448MS20_9PAST|nr:ADP-ribose pyrophosphatase [Rodentibacter pneumotropicus]